jgi:hypothetical protein
VRHRALPCLLRLSFHVIVICVRQCGVGVSVCASRVTVPRGRAAAAGEAKIRADGSCGLACFHTYAYIVIDKCAPFSRKVSRSSGPSSTPYAPTEPKRLEAASLDERMRYKCGMATTSRWPALHTECRSVCVPRIA